MANKHVQHAFIANDARAWGIFEDEPGAEGVAQELNRSFNALAREAFMSMANGETHVSAVTKVRVEMCKVLFEYARYGTSTNDVAVSLGMALRQAFDMNLYQFEARQEQ